MPGLALRKALRSRQFSNHEMVSMKSFTNLQPNRHVQSHLKARLNTVTNSIISTFRPSCSNSYVADLSQVRFHGLFPYNISGASKY